MVGLGSRALKPDPSSSISSPLLQKPFNLTRLKRERPATNSSFPTSFLARFGRFQQPKHQIRRFSTQFRGKKHRIWRNLYQIRLDHTGSWTNRERSWTDRERSRRFSPFFGGFQWVSTSPETDAHSTGNRPVKPNLQQVGYGLGTCLPDLRQVGHKPDPPNP